MGESAQCCFTIRLEGDAYGSKKTALLMLAAVSKNRNLAEICCGRERGLLMKKFCRPNMADLFQAATDPNSHMFAHGSVWDSAVSKPWI